MVTIKLPRLVGARPAVGPFLAAVPDRLDGQDVELDCRALLSGTPSFADEVVLRVVRDRGAGRLVVEGAYPEFAGWLAEAAAEHGATHRIAFPDARPRA